MDNRTIGQIACDAFMVKLEELMGLPGSERWRSYLDWAVLPQMERDAWEAAAKAIWRRADLEHEIAERMNFERRSVAFLATTE